MDSHNEFLDLSNIIEENTEFIPLLSNEDEAQMNNEDVPEELPLLPLRNMVLFPGVVIPITVGRDKSIQLIRDAYQGKKIISVVAQLDANEEDPSPKQLHKVGTVAQIIKELRMPDGSTTVIIQGKRRIHIDEVVATEPYMVARITPIEPEMAPRDQQFDVMVDAIKDIALKIIKINPNIPSEASIAIRNIDSSSFLINFISSNMNAPVGNKQKLLETRELSERARMTLAFLTKDLQVLEMKNEIQDKVRNDIDQQQREFFLQQQMKTIQEELGGDPLWQEIEDFRAKAEEKNLPENVMKAFEKELEKLSRMNQASAEFSVQHNYIEVLLDLPWRERSEDNFDLNRAKEVLDRDHCGLDKVKERILEHLAVLKLKGNMKAPIICLVGPPGVGKTSLGKSVADALGRKYVRMSLGGMHDEAEIRGHRKTYIGAMPGRIMQNMKKAGTVNPVFVLDEIDKVNRDAHGDPSSALLEVLDPEQNNTFYDNFIELDYDLSNVLFIATANKLNTIQPALRDRLEIIEVNGYTVEEKIDIAKIHLIPKQLKEHGLKRSQLRISKSVLGKIIESHTYEAGVRQLEKSIAKLSRVAARHIAMDEEYAPAVAATQLDELLGPGRSRSRYLKVDVAGVVTGLAWTYAGGDILFIETNLSKGKAGTLTLTGNLGDVMKESASIAYEYIKSHAELLSIDPAVLEKYHVHIHVPEGATPKDGPSAGIAMVCALSSAFTQRKVRSKLAMTGEITLRGSVLPVGGIKEKLLAARRAGITRVILPDENRKDVAQIEEKYVRDIDIVYADKIDEVINTALLPTKVKNARKII